MAKDKEDKLAQDAAAARAANMSYGKWKGLQNPVVIEKKIPDGWKVCEYRHCCMPYKPRNGSQKFCGPICGIRERKEQEREKRQAPEQKGENLPE